MISLATLMTGIEKIRGVGGALILHIPEVRAIVDSAITALHPGDQDEAKATFEDMLEDTQEHRARVRAKLEALKTR